MRSLNYHSPLAAVVAVLPAVVIVAALASASGACPPDVPQFQAQVGYGVGCGVQAQAQVYAPQAFAVPVYAAPQAVAFTPSYGYAPAAQFSFRARGTAGHRVFAPQPPRVRLFGGRARSVQVIRQRGNVAVDVGY